MNLISLIEQAAAKEKDKSFLVCEKRKLTYGQFLSRIGSFAAGIRAMGLKKGDRVAILLNNSIEFLETYFGVIAAGAVIVPLNTFLKSDEIEYILNDCRVKFLVTSNDFKTPVSGLKLGRLEYLEGIMTVTPVEGVKTTDFEAVFSKESTYKEEPGLDDMAVIIYTPGTTGKPKGAMLSHRNLATDAANSVDIIGIKTKDVFMCFLPMFHSYSFMANVIVPIYRHCKIVIVRSIQPFARVIKNLLIHRVSVFIAIPPIYSVLSEAKIPFYVFLLNPMRVSISGGASLPVEVLKKYEKRFKVPLIEGYGLSEASPICALNPLFGKRKPGSIGLPINNVSIKIFDDSGNEMKTGETGELAVKGDNVMLGYYNNPAATAETIKNGWLHTGDIGKKDEEGFIHILDRKKDMIIVNGMNVYPREVEEVLYSHPAIADAAVVGEKDAVHGEIPIAIVLLKEGHAADEKEIRSFVKKRIANYKVPHRVEFWKEMPRNATGKVLKREIKRMIEEGKKS